MRAGMALALGVGAFGCTDGVGPEDPGPTPPPSSYAIVYEGRPDGAPELPRVRIDRDSVPQRILPAGTIGVTSVLFGVWHGLDYSDGHVGFDVMSALFPFLGSLPGGWLRFKTRSLLAPVLGHGVANAAFHLAGGLGG